MDSVALVVSGRVLVTVVSDSVSDSGDPNLHVTLCISLGSHSVAGKAFGASRSSPNAFRHPLGTPWPWLLLSGGVGLSWETVVCVHRNEQ